VGGPRGAGAWITVRYGHAGPAFDAEDEGTPRRSNSSKDELQIEAAKPRACAIAVARQYQVNNRNNKAVGAVVAAPGYGVASYVNHNTLSLLNRQIRTLML